jgi:hypothetical protein
MKIILSKIYFIEIKYIKSIVPQILLNKFERLNLITIKDILDTSIESFESGKWISTKAIVSFKNLKKDIIKNPNKYYKIYLQNKEANLPQKLLKDYNIIKNLKLFINDYKKLCDPERNIEIIIKRYGLGKDVFTLQKIGTCYNLSRERARQIKDEEIIRIKKLFSGITISNPPCKCREEFVSSISDVLLLVCAHSTISFHRINISLNEKYGFQIKNEDINYLNFFMNVFGFDSHTYLNNYIYYNTQKFSLVTLKQLLKTIYKTLEINIYPLDAASIVVRVKKVLKRNKLLSDTDILNIIDQIIEFEKVIINGEINYQLRIDLLSSAGDMGIRILNENKQSMHYNDLVKVINQKLAHNNSSRLATPDSLKIQFMSSPDVIARGYTGYWSLIEWGEDSSTIISIIQAALSSSDSPLTYNEIFEYIALKRPDIKKGSIRAVIYQNKNKFLRLNDKRIILKKWSYKYNDQLFTSSTALMKSYDDKQIMQQIAKIFEDNSTNCLSSMYIRKSLKKSGFLIKDSTFYKKISKYPILRRQYYNSKNIILKDNYKSLLRKISVKKEKMLKPDIIKKEIFAILGKNNNIILQSKLIKILKNEFGFHRAIVYTILRTDKSFRKQFNGNYKTYISVNKDT